MFSVAVSLFDASQPPPYPLVMPQPNKQSGRTGIACPSLPVTKYDGNTTSYEHRNPTHVTSEDQAIMESIGSTMKMLNGRRILRMEFRYLVDRRVTTWHISGGHIIKWIEPGVTIDNAWILSLLRDDQIDMRQAACLIMERADESYSDFIPRRAFQHDARRTLLANVLNRFGSRCAKCQRDVRGLRFHLDHHWPRSRGGKLDDANTVLLCQHCNCSKSNTPPKEFYTAEELERIETVLRSYAS